MSKVSTSTRAAAAAVGVALAATAAALDPQQFVAGWPIEVPSGAEVFDVPLTADVYAAASSFDQLAVLDANGEPQAFFRRVVPPVEPAEQGVVLEASPLYAGGTAVSPNVGVTTSERGTSVTVTPGASSSPAITGFVLDARALETAPDRARARLARVAAAVPARRRRSSRARISRAGAASVERPSPRLRSAAPRRGTRACPCALAPAVTTASRRAAMSPTGSCCARRWSAPRRNRRRRRA